MATVQAFFEAEPGQSRTFLLEVIPKDSVRTRESISYLASCCRKWVQWYFRLSRGMPLQCYLLQVQPWNEEWDVEESVLILLTYMEVHTLANVQKSMERSKVYGILGAPFYETCQSTKIGDKASLHVWEFTAFHQERHGWGNAYKAGEDGDIDLAIYPGLQNIIEPTFASDEPKALSVTEILQPLNRALAKQAFAAIESGVQTQQPSIKDCDHHFKFVTGVYPVVFEGTNVEVVEIEEDYHKAKCQGADCGRLSDTCFQCVGCEKLICGNCEAKQRVAEHNQQVAIELVAEIKACIEQNHNCASGSIWFEYKAGATCCYLVGKAEKGNQRQLDAVLFEMQDFKPQVTSLPLFAETYLRLYPETDMKYAPRKVLALFSLYLSGETPVVLKPKLLDPRLRQQFMQVFDPNWKCKGGDPQPQQGVPSYGEILEPLLAAMGTDKEHTVFEAIEAKYGGPPPPQQPPFKMVGNVQFPWMEGRYDLPGVLHRRHLSEQPENQMPEPPSSSSSSTPPQSSSSSAPTPGPGGVLRRKRRN